MQDAMLGLAVTQRPPRLSERSEWREAFLCGTLTGLQPLVALDGSMIADGAAGEWTRLLARALLDDEEQAVAKYEGSAP